MDRRTFTGAAAACGLGIAALPPAWGQLLGGAQPVLVVPFPAGGLSDVLARAIAPALGRELGANVVVDNIAGASGSLAAAKVLARGAAGDTLVLASPTELILAPASLRSAKYRPGDFRLVAPIVRGPLALFVRGELPVRDIDEFVAYAKERAAKPLNYGSVGIGSIYHLATEELRAAAGLELTHVPYRGGAPLLQDLMGGSLDMVLFTADGNTAKLIGGRARAIGVTSAARSPVYPDAQTFAESRALPQFTTLDVWGGIFMPAATPDGAARTLHRAMQAVLADADVRKALEASSGNPVMAPMTLEQLSDFYAAETARYTAAFRKLNIEPS